MFKEMFGAFKKPETPDEQLLGLERELLKPREGMSLEDQSAIKGLIKQSTDFFNQQI